MSGFVRADFVEEFAFRTRSNYYSLRIAQAKENHQDDVVDKYEKELFMLKQEMTRSRYRTKENYFEVTQLINSLVGLLIFPEQQYYEALKKPQLSMKDDLKTLNGILSDNMNGRFFCSYKEQMQVELDTTKQERFKSGKEKAAVTREVFMELDSEVESPCVLLRHMRNAVAHENVGIIPVSRNDTITAVAFEDYARGRLDRDNKNRDNYFYASYSPINKIPDKERIRDDPLYGYFRLEIDVEALEPVLIEISNAILRVAREG